MTPAADISLGEKSIDDPRNTQFGSPKLCRRRRIVESRCQRRSFFGVGECGLFQKKVTNLSH